MRRLVLLLISSGVVLLYGCTTSPERLGLVYSGATHADNVRLLVDETWVDTNGTRFVEQEIFESVFEMIDSAEEFILLDLFLVNDFGYEPGPGLWRSNQVLADKLVAKRRASPGVEIIFITDPINSVYSSFDSPQFRAMEQAGVRVVWTDLDKLRDSNPLYSKPWRVFVKPFGVGPGNTIKNPVGEGRISFRSFCKILNFKANHRKLVVTEKSLLVTSANPHSASSAHWNTALRIDGAGQSMALAAESAVLRLSGSESFLPGGVGLGDSSLPKNLELLTERKIKEKVLELLANAEPGARIDLTMFYLSEEEVVRAFIKAHERGCKVRVVLDPSKDAFGRTKNGVPNRQSGRKLVKAGIPLRWTETHGEQNHVKMLYVEHPDKSAALLLGSSNFTRRNLSNFNCEADLAFTASVDHAAMARARTLFDRWWDNDGNRIYTVEYAVYEDHSVWRRCRAWWMENTGMGTF
jgi:hypothetical protein